MSSVLPADLNVSRETFERLEILVALLRKWNKRINLVSKHSVDDVWQRHIADSIQIWPIVQALDTKKWVDIGSGGGFPGLIIAARNFERDPTGKTTMIESDVRKCSFLRTALREMGVNGEVICQRIESVEPQRASILSARALSELTNLLEFANLHLAPGGTAIFPKGVNWKKEVEIAQESWSFSYEAITSKTQEGAIILKIGEISRV